MTLSHQKAQTLLGQRAVARMALGACQAPGDYCQAFFRFYCDPAIWQQAVAKLRDKPWAVSESQLSALLMEVPWGHNILIFTKCSSVAEAGFYINQTFEQGWSRDVLALQLKSNLYARTGRAVTNFSRTLPLPQSDLAQQNLKDPYNFDFMAMKAIHMVEIARR